MDARMCCVFCFTVDATFLGWKYMGQWAAAIGVDGHSWMFPLAFGIL